ncbi:MAG: aldo/keto reductase [Lachnospiraceae bacterium]|nr:aldo/keto reductase [Lachnospiraceae bacterium]
MYYRKLGDTGLKVSEISFGTIPVLQGSVPVLPDYFNLDEKEAIAVMEHAYRLGCNLYDTAIVPEYGDAEIKLGKFAELVGRDNIIISDKARFFGGSEMYQAVEVSCENLGTTPDIYFVHQVDADHEEEVFGRGGALDALAELKAEGKIRYAGVATHYYDILLRGAQDNRVDVLQGSGNLLERGMLDRVREESLFRKKGFLVNKVYAAGLLPARFPVRTLIDFVLSYPVSSVLIGLGTREQVNAAMEWDARVRETDILSFEEVLSVLEKEYIPISCDRCQRCVCPYGTEIHTLFRQYQYFYLGKDYWALKKLDLGIAESARHCRECVEMTCMDACPRKIRIAQEMQKVERLVRDYPIGRRTED